MWANSLLRDGIKREYGICETYPNPDKKGIKDIQVEISWTEKEVEEILQYMQDYKKRVPAKIK